MSYQAVTLTVSDSCAAGTRTDTSGPAIRAMLENAGFAVQAMQTVPDEEGQISAAIVHACDVLQADLVVTTGGTGLSPRDVTPEATLAVLDREIRAIPVAMWVEGLKSTPRAMLSRAVAGTRGHTLVLGPKRVIGAWVLRVFGFKMVMTWWSAIFATVVVIFPLMYRTVRGAFESFDETLSYAGKTLGLSNSYIFWRIRMPYCRQGMLDGTVLAFARALGEYGATSMITGYTPDRTATISTTVYQLWRTDQDAEAFKWVCINVAISAIVLLAVNMLERRNRRGRARREDA